MTPDPRALFQRHGLEAEHLEAAGGMNSAVWLSETHALKLAKSEGVDFAREAHLALHALKIGIRTARPIFWNAEYSLWERLPGVAAAPPQTRAVWEALLLDLERLHTDPPEAAPPAHLWRARTITGEISLLASGSWGADLALLESEFARGFTDAERKTIEALFRPRAVQRLCFVHGDAFAANVFVENGEYTGLIDWGNAGWHAPEREYAWMEDEALELALKRYELNLNLLCGLRLELFLLAAQHGRVSLETARAVLEWLV